jgi:hypothetical protein
MHYVNLHRTYIAQLGFEVNCEVDEYSDTFTQARAYTELVSFLIKLKSGEIDGDGMPITWMGALATINNHLRSTYINSEENMREAKSSVSYSLHCCICLEETYSIAF